MHISRTPSVTTLEPFKSAKMLIWCCPLPITREESRNLGRRNNHETSLPTNRHSATQQEGLGKSGDTLTDPNIVASCKLMGVFKGAAEVVGEVSCTERVEKRSLNRGRLGISPRSLATCINLSPRIVLSAKPLTFLISNFHQIWIWFIPKEF